MENLRPFEILAFRLVNILNFYLWPLPFRWSKGFQELQFTRFSLRLIPVYISVFTQFLFGLVAVLSVGFPGHIQTMSGREVHTVHFGIWVIACVSYWSFSFGLALVLWHADVLIPSFNRLLRMSASLTKADDKKSKNSFDELCNSTLPLAVLISSCGPYFLLTGCMLADIDFGYYIMEMILPVATTRNMSMVLFGLFCRFIMIFPAGIEIVRSGNFLICIGMVVLQRTMELLRMLISSTKDFHDFLQIYTCMTLLYMNCYKFVQIIVYMILSVSFWFLVIIAWISVKCSPVDVSYPIYLVCTFGTVALIILYCIGLPLICGALDMATGVVQVRLLRCKLLYSKRNRFQEKINALRCRAVLPIRLKYAEFWYINGEMKPDYVWMIQERLFDSILTIDN